MCPAALNRLHQSPVNSHRCVAVAAVVVVGRSGSRRRRRHRRIQRKFCPYDPAGAFCMHSAWQLCDVDTPRRFSVPGQRPAEKDRSIWTPDLHSREWTTSRESVSAYPRRPEEGERTSLSRPSPVREFNVRP